MKIPGPLKRPLPLYVVKYGKGYVVGEHTVSCGDGAQANALAWRTRAGAKRMVDAWGKYWGLRVVRVVARRTYVDGVGTVRCRKCGGVIVDGRCGNHG